DPVAPSQVSDVRNDDQVASLNEAVRLYHDPLEGFVVLGPESQGFLYPSIHARERAPRCGPVQLEIGVVERPQSVNVTPTVGAEAAAHDLHVLRRHRLPPLLGEPFGGSAGLVDVEVGRVPFDEPVSPRGYRCHATLNEAGAASEPTTQKEDNER